MSLFCTSSLKFTANGIRSVDAPDTYPKPLDYLAVRATDVYDGKDVKFLSVKDNGEWVEQR